MSWPTRVLNESNQKLQHKIDRARDEIQRTTAEIEAERETVTLLQANISQLRRHVNSGVKATSEKRENLQHDENELQTLEREREHQRMKLQTLQHRDEELRLLLNNSNNIHQTKTAALAQEHALSEVLEQAALELYEVYTTHKNLKETQEEVKSRSQRRLAKVRDSLIKFHNKLNTSQNILKSEEAEFTRVGQELQVVRRSIEEGKHDIIESSLSVTHVRQAVTGIERETIINAEAYENLGATLDTKRKVLHELKEKYNILSIELQKSSKQLESRKRDRDSLNMNLHIISNKVQQQEEMTAAIRRQLSAQEDVKREVKLSRDNAYAHLEERNKQLQILFLRFQELETLKREVNNNNKNKNALEYKRQLENMWNSLQRNLQQLNNRLEILRVATAESFSRLLQEGRIAEELNIEVSKVKESLTIAERDYVTKQKSREEYQCHIENLESHILILRERLEESRDIIRENNKREQTITENNIRELRDKLQIEEQRGISLRRDITPLRCNLHTHIKRLHKSHAEAKYLKSAIAQTQLELQRVEKDAFLIAEEKQAAGLHYEGALFRWKTIRRAADSHVALVRGVAGMEEILRLQALTAEETLAVDVKNFVLELHLERKAQTEKQIELRRCQTRLQQLKERYQSSMESMGRNLVVAATNSDNEKREIDLQILPFNDPPEVLHAKCILNSSSVREQLQERGNYLDGRIVFLEHETSTLRKMSQAIHESVIKGNSNISPNTTTKKFLKGPRDSKETQYLCEIVEGSRRAVESELKHMGEVIYTLQSRKRDLSQRRKDVTKRLNELKIIKRQRESVLRQLKVQLKRTNQKPKKHPHQVSVFGY